MNAEVAAERADADVWLPWREGFGDLWASTNYLLWLSALQGRPVQVVRRGVSSDVGPRCLDIAAQLDSPGELVVVDGPHTRALDGAHAWRLPYAPTRMRWGPVVGRRHIVYQFDGVSAAEAKNPNPLEVSEVLRACQMVGLPCIALGKMFSVRRCVELAAQAVFFVGCDSGMSHLVHSVGTPCFLLQYQLGLDVCHRGKAVTVCTSANDFRTKLESYLQCLSSMPL